MNSKEYMAYCLMEEVAKNNHTQIAQIFFELFQPEEPEEAEVFEPMESCFDFPKH